MPQSQANVLSAFAKALRLPSDSEPFVIINKALSKLGLTRADLTPTNAEELDLIDGPPTLVPGDQIMVRTAKFITGHQVIFVGKIKGVTSVVDFWGPDKASAKIAIRPMSTLMKGRDQLLVFRYKCDESSNVWRELTKELALSFASNANPCLLYDALSNNCETFASFCRTFRYGSPATKDTVAILASMVPAHARSLSLK